MKLSSLTGKGLKLKNYLNRVQRITPKLPELHTRTFLIMTALRALMREKNHQGKRRKDQKIREEMDKFHPLIVRLNLLFILALTACDPSLVFEESQNLKGASWNIDTRLTYQVNIRDTAEINNLFVTTRNLGSYHNSNLFLFITTTSPTGATLRDTLDIVLADNNGRWKGKGIGDLFYLKTPW